ncbi:MAG: hypothetical protein AB3N16_08015 [Flavobacteriaceae bacterium]
MKLLSYAFWDKPVFSGWVHGVLPNFVTEIQHLVRITSMNQNTGHTVIAMSTTTALCTDAH